MEIHSVRPAVRRSLQGTSATDLVIEITQRRDGYFEQKDQEAMDRPEGGRRRRLKPDFRYRAGATIIIEPATREVRRVIRTPGTIADNDELERVRRFLLGERAGSGNAFDGGVALSLSLRHPAARNEPFALLHGLEEVR